MIGLGSSSTMGIGLALYLDDQISQQGQKVRGVMSALNQDTDKLVASFNRMDDFGQKLSNVGTGMLRSLAPAVKSYAHFEDIMNSVRVIAGDQGLTEIDYQKMITQVKSLGEAYGILPQDIANAQLELAKAGIKPTEIMKMTEATMALGAATDTVVSGAGGAAEMLVNVMQAFNATADEADRFAAVMTAAANESTIDVTDFYQSMRYTADIARSLSIPIEDTSAAIAMLGNAGLKGSIAGTSLANMYRYLAKAVGQFGLKRQKEALGMLGIDESDILTAEGSLKSLSEILALFRTRYSEMTDVERLAATQGLFGVRGDRAAQPLIRALRMDTLGPDGLPIAAFEDMLAKINRGVEVNLHVEQAQDRLNDLMGDWTKFMSAVERLKIAIGGALGPTLRPLIRGLQQGVMSLTEFFEGSVGRGLVRLFTGVGVWAVVVGKFISAGARFYKYILTSTGSLSKAFKDSTRAAHVINRSLIHSSTQFLANVTTAANTWVAAALKARGVTGHMTAAGPVLVGRNPASGKFTGGKAPRNFLSTALGLMFGKTGLKWAATLTGKFGGLAKSLGPVGKILGSLGSIGGGVVKVFGGLFRGIGWLLPRLFGWKVLIADFVAQLVFGKGIFETLWDVIKGLTNYIMTFIDNNKWILQSPKEVIGDWFRGLGVSKEDKQTQSFMGQRTDAERRYIQSLMSGKSAQEASELMRVIQSLSPEEMTRFGERVKVHHETPKGLDAMTDEDRQRMFQNMESIMGNGEVNNTTNNSSPTVVNLTINPQSDKTVKKTINIDSERRLQGYAVNA